MSEPRTATAADVETVAEVLGAGFADDPVLAWVTGHADSEAKLTDLFRCVVGQVVLPMGATHLVARSCAAWTPPEPAPWTDAEVEAMGRALAPRWTPADQERLGVLGAATDAVHPTEPHWYLGTIAAEPASRGRGLGSVLLAHGLARVDADGLPAYLESSNPRNVGLYQRHGFEVTGTIELPGGPSLTAMWRPPHPAR